MYINLPNFLVKSNEMIISSEKLVMPETGEMQWESRNSPGDRKSLQQWYRGPLVITQEVLCSWCTCSILRGLNIGAMRCVIYGC